MRKLEIKNMNRTNDFNQLEIKTTITKFFYISAGNLKMRIIEFIFCLLNQILITMCQILLHSLNVFQFQYYYSQKNHLIGNLHENVKEFFSWSIDYLYEIIGCLHLKHIHVIILISYEQKDKFNN